MARLVRSLNLAGREVYEPPMQSTSTADRAFLINEVGFELAAARLGGQKASMLAALLAVEQAFREVDQIEEVDFSLARHEQREAIELGNRILRGITERIRQNGEFTRRPTLKGLGAIVTASADMSFGKCLIEIKAGDRKIRSIDLRQVIIYYVLSSFRENGAYEDCYIVNPRQGVRLYFRFDDLIAAVSAKPPVEFVASFSDYLIDWNANA